MADTAAALKLTADGALKALNASIEKAQSMGVPQCISIVDAGGHLLAFCRMDGAFVLSNDSSLKKAKTAAIYGQLTGQMDDAIALLGRIRHCDWVANITNNPVQFVSCFRRNGFDLITVLFQSKNANCNSTCI